MNVYVFKTSITKTDLAEITFILNDVLPNTKWNFDFEDIDNILRIESQIDISQIVISELTAKNYLCEELE
jgi:hypothetical protein